MGQVHVHDPETGAVFSLHDAGPDTWSAAMHALPLRPRGGLTTGTGVIGRVVRDLATGERVFEAGKPIGDFVERVCEALT